MMLFAEQRRKLALFICPEIRNWPKSHSILPVEVQTEPGSVWQPAQFIDGVLHWTPAPMGSAEAARLEAMCGAYARANQKVPAGIRSALAAASRQSAAEEIRPASQMHRDVDQNDGEAMLRFRFPRSAQQGAL